MRWGLRKASYVFIGGLAPFAYRGVRMSSALREGLANYVCMVIVITLHEFGHAWTASRCGDDTARSLGRVTINPLAHIDLIGTVLLPLLALGLSLSGYANIAGGIIGWGKPVPVNYANLRKTDRDALLVAMG